MKRRDFTTALLGGALGVWPLAARAEQASPVVGFLRMTSAADSAHLAAAFREGLRQSGFIEGQNVSIEYRYAENHRDRAPALAGELIERRVALIATDQAVDAAKAATSAIPILFVLGADPVADGLVASLNRPGANVTGTSSFLRSSGRNASSCCVNLYQPRRRSASSPIRSVPKTRPSEARSRQP